MSKRTKVFLTIYGLLTLASAIACFAYPDDWVFPLPLAAVFGPFMALNLGFAGGAPILILCMALALPLAWHSNVITWILLLAGITLWGYTGYSVGGLLYA